MEEEGGGEGLIARRMSNKNTALVGKENEINWKGGWRGLDLLMTDKGNIISIYGEGGGRIFNLDNRLKIFQLINFVYN